MAQQSVFRRSQVDLDLIELADYIARDNLDAALRFIHAAEESFQFLAEQSMAGEACQFTDASHVGIRVWHVRRFPNYLIFYRQVNEGVEVIRVLHGARDLRALLAP